MVLSNSNLKAKNIIEANDNQFLVRYIINNNSKPNSTNNDITDILIEITPIYDEFSNIKYLILQELSSIEKVSIDSSEKGYSLSSRIKGIRDSYSLDKYLNEKILPLSSQKVIFFDKKVLRKQDFTDNLTTTIYYCRLIESDHKNDIY